MVWPVAPVDDCAAGALLPGAPHAAAVTAVAATAAATAQRRDRAAGRRRSPGETGREGNTAAPWVCGCEEVRGGGLGVRGSGEAAQTVVETVWPRSAAPVPTAGRSVPSGGSAPGTEQAAAAICTPRPQAAATSS